MTSVICDHCKKSIPNAVRQVNYKTILDKTLCLPCNKELDEVVNERVYKDGSYSLDGFKTYLRDELEKYTR